ncbi:type II CRISPR-associated endonuclease Cas1 [Tannockella kyphosi]|uniref:type II CRISPR-associated endonuclease Cas1 n=1 Tax=Tannockella kyphosi TaxID=2899121 RepID=UPI0020119B5D|nr:type II CRISPR-associated endonuclease Cas1 [Tannockella kyphosi]
MTWRTVVITRKCKLSYKNNYLLVRNEKVEMIHLSEINTIIVDSTMVSITTYLLVELVKNKIKLVVCDNERNPLGEFVPYYGRYNSSKIIQKQIHWEVDTSQNVWTTIIKQKIINQAKLLSKLDIDTANLIYEYHDGVRLYDVTNREGHAAKVYFNSLFGKNFTRDDDSSINKALNYGYSILLSNFNKEIVSCGYLTQIGLKHCNEYNYFNLSSDLMEPYRILIDEIVYENRFDRFDGGFKLKLIGVLNKKILIDGKEQYVSNALSIYVKSVFNSLDTGEVNQLSLYDFV